ncbi:MAG: hypothetical protein EHM85_02245 [Desulfobacteraceae bacterium]|nr:MAG: hypothetical protein EHM85_02245 [Desulfobacteraceae bacterium]
MRRVASFLLICISITIFMLLIPGNAGADTLRGIYGAPADLSDDSPFRKGATAESSGVNAVFVSQKNDAVRRYKEQGFKVFISVNAFGGKRAWDKYPDSRPVKANGKKLGEDKSDKGQEGTCPTHVKWREDRLRHIKHLADVLGKDQGIDGIWLDYIRYPGFWETQKPEIPDTCYCERCLNKFQADRKIIIPPGKIAGEAASWINKNCPYEWMAWKKEQINSFVRDVKAILAVHPEKITLGLFTVPWRKGEKNNAISYLLAQDSFLLSEIADVVSPMLYHKMCGRDVDWVGRMTQYYKETAGCSVWPIIQSHDLNPDEFKKAAENCGKAGADGMLVFSCGGINDSKFEKKKMWEALRDFEPQENLIINPGFEPKQGSVYPKGWRPGESEIDPALKSVFTVKKAEEIDKDENMRNFYSLGISSGYGNDGKWTGSIKPSGCRDDEEYIFSGLFYRDNWKNSVYPSVTLFGEKYYLDNHWKTKIFQPIKVHVKCREKADAGSVVFANENPGETFYVGAPKLARHHSFSNKAGMNEGERKQQFYKNFFPIGVYGADMDNLAEIKRLAVNTVIIGGEGEKLKKTIEKCHEIGLRYFLSVPHDPDRLKPYLDYLMPPTFPGDKMKREILRRHDAAFYVNDEPELTSFPANKASDIFELIKSRIPEAPACMAVVRPSNCREYLEAADFFMMDQYPVPNMPMTWLSDSIDRASAIAGNERITAVIQAFGGEAYESAGWPRIPTWREMDCLAFLSVVHGSRGIFFFTFSEIGKTKKGRESLGRVVGRLNQVYPWLLENNLDIKVPVDMTSGNRFDPSGRPSVHCCVKAKGEKRLIMAVNSIGTRVEAQIGASAAAGNGKNAFFTEVFSGIKFPVIDGRISVKFDPYETKVFLSDK